MPWAGNAAGSDSLVGASATQLFSNARAKTIVPLALVKAPSPLSGAAVRFAFKKASPSVVATMTTGIGRVPAGCATAPAAARLGGKYATTAPFSSRLAPMPSCDLSKSIGRPIESRPP